MNAIRVHTTIENDGELYLRELPYKKGQHVEMILLVKQEGAKQPRPLTAGALLRSKLVGLWEKRKDIEESSKFARQLREQAQYRDGK